MQKQHSARRKRNRVRARFFSLFFTILIVAVIGYFFWKTTTSMHLPNLHGWKSCEVLDFAKDHNIEVHFEFVYSPDIAPTLVMSQSAPPRTAITEGMSLSIQISKGIEVR